MTGDPLVERDQIVSDLRSALYEGGSGLRYVPRLLKRVLEDGSWRERFDAKSRKVVRFERFIEFVTAQATEGLGADEDLVRRIVADDAETADLLDQALQNPVGRPRITGVNHSSNADEQAKRDRSTQHLRRLRKDFPELHAAVIDGRLSVNAAAVEAGIYPRRAAVSLTDPASAVRTLRTKASPEFLVELRRLFDE